MLKLIKMTVNGKEVETAVDPRESLLDTLRNRLGLTSVKRGCEVGECGACTVLVDGEAIDSCIYLAVWAEGRTILTVEGLRGPNGELSPIQQAFIEEAAVQCGFCTPGLIMTAVEIVGSGKRYTREELRKLFVELRAQGRNLNQIAAAANRIASVAWRDDVDAGLIDQLTTDLREDNERTRAAINDAVARIAKISDDADFRTGVVNGRRKGGDGDGDA